MNKLSKREKIMLYLLCVVGILAAAVLLVIQPALNKGTELDAVIAENQTTYGNMQMVIARAQGMEQRIEESRAGIEETMTLFLPKMSSNELDTYITGLIQNKGLTSQELVMSQPEEQAPSDAVTLVQIDVVATGYANQFNALIDQVEDTDGLRMTACKLTIEKAQTPAATESPKPKKTPRPNPRATPSPTPTPTATPAPDAYSMQLTFLAAECDPSVLSEVLGGAE